MSQTANAFNPPLIPDVPEPIIAAASQGKLRLFVGAGASILAGSPSWDGLADGVLRQLCECGELNYAELEQLAKLDAKKKLSIAKDISISSKMPIDYKKIIVPKEPSREQLEIFMNMLEIGGVFVTTNYDSWFEKAYELASQKLDATELAKEAQSQDSRMKPTLETVWRVEQLTANLLYKARCVIHLHGSLEDTDNMVISTRDYLNHYIKENVKDFLRILFDEFTVLFIGYGIEETEILEHVFRKNPVVSDGRLEARHYWLFPVFSHEGRLFHRLQYYYRNHCNVELIGFTKDKNNHRQLVYVIQDWAKRITVKPPGFSEKAKLIERVFQ